MKKLLIIIISITILMISVPLASFANENSTYDMTTNFTDISGHWAEEAINGWYDKGLLAGYNDETFKPNSNISRIEFIILVNRLYGYYEKADENYIDIQNNIWYSTDCNIAKANGYMDWYEAEELNPTEKLTRAEASAVITTILQLESTENYIGIERFNDKDKVPEWSRSYVDAVVNAGIIVGYEVDNTLRAENNITRAEAVTMLDRAMGELIYQVGSYGPEEGKQIITSNLTINTSEVALKNTVIEGDLILAAGIADGNIDLNNVKVNGRTIINGGGENSITITGSEFGEIKVYKIGGHIRVVLKDSESEKVILQSGVKLEGDFENILIDSKANIHIVGDTVINNIETTDKSEGTIVAIEETGIINNFVFNASTVVTGIGAIKLAIVNANDSSTEQYCDAKTTKNGIDSREVKVKKHTVYIPPAPAVPVPSNEKVIVSTTVGALSGGNLIDVPEGITVADLIAKLTVSNLATKTILASPGGSVAGDGDNVDNNMKILVTAEDGTSAEYDIATTDGTIVANSYHIYTAEDLNAVRGGVEGYPGWDLTKNYILENDIDLEAFILANYDSDTDLAGIQGGWVPIGNSGFESEFSGIFDGNNKTISNLTINRNSNYQGLFGYSDTSANITNVKLTNVNINQDMVLGAIWHTGGLIGANLGDISNSSVTGKIKGVNYVGGLVGKMFSGNASNCNASTYVDGSDYTGGLIGCSNPPAIVSDSYATGDVMGNNFVGGLVGENFGQVKTSYSTGSVSGLISVGGLIGYSGGQLSESYASGNVTGTDNIGGLVGESRNSINNSYATGSAAGTNNVGGLVGLVVYKSSIAVSCTYATGSISGTKYVGGLIGQSWGSTIAKSYALNETITRTSGSNSSFMRLLAINIDGSTLTNNYANSGMIFSGIVHTPTSDVNDSDGGDISLDDTKSLTTYESNSWNIGSGEDVALIWWIDEGNSFPILSWQH